MLPLALCLLAAVAPRLGAAPCFRQGSAMSCVNRRLTRPPAVPRGVTSLDLAFNRIGRLEQGSFPGAGGLRGLRVALQKTGRLVVGPKAFWNLPNLTYLDLGGNRELALDRDAFSGLGRLQELQLDLNGLNDSILQEGYFRDLLSLHTLGLRSNELRHVRPDPSFSRLRALQNVDFSFNRIGQVCEGDLSPVQHRLFRSFDLSKNRQLYRGAAFSWSRCGNPFRHIMLYTLDLSEIGLGVPQLQHLFQALAGTLVLELRMRSLSIGASFGYSNLPDPDNRTFSGLADSSVMKLDLSHGFIFALRPGVFAPLAALKSLTLAANRINGVERGAFSGLEGLLTLNLSRNLLGELYSWSFHGLRNLSHLDLHHNHIGVIQAGCFDHLADLVTLNLRENTLSSVPGAEPRYLLLGWNRLRSAYGLQAGAATTFLDLSDNVLDDLGVLSPIMRLPALTHLLLRDNRVSRCSAEPSVPRANRLLHLDVSGNFLQLVWAAGRCRDVFGHLGRLTELLLHRNYLTELPPGLFRGLSSLKRLNLSLNSLTRLPRDLLPPGLEILDVSRNRLVSPDPRAFRFVLRLDLTHNQFICDCTLAPFLRWLNRSRAQLVGAPGDLACAFPEGLSGTPLGRRDLGCGVEHVQFALFACTAALLLGFLASALLGGRCRSSLRLACGALRRAAGAAGGAGGDGAFRFDAYLCFSGRDLEWVTEALLRQLDAQFNERSALRLCLEERDFTPGQDHIANIRDAIWSSRKTLCVVTRRFLHDGWCLEAFNVAQSRLFHEMKDVVVLLVVGALRDYQLRRYQPMRAYLQARPYLRWPADADGQRCLLQTLADKIRQRPEPRRGGLGLLRWRKPDAGIRLQRVATITN
ncbi:toll-like receptor 5 isoform X2 [Narcine bancroftii]